ncbi:TRAP transporter large permease [Dethiobacter alkaliphilus]|uniref:TRAP transporter large permease n=1 Tax=Dethiobacter alkaliphilus TaxID=427926 RepID=UPI002227D7B1|nr:TRAP transporter large permease [Dethiobacter alkaliphilus]MCW3489417.1 TRAP transporter large permease [Dethiobacter alkaliphilus]
MTTILFLSFIVLVLLGVPIAFTLGISSLLAINYQGTIPLTVVFQRTFTAIDSFPLLAIPFFMMAGSLMNTGGVSKRLIEFANAVVGHLVGGLAYATAVASMLFAAVSGSGGATTSAIGSMLVPALIKKGYRKDFASALQAASGSLGVIIPPSIPFVLYGFMSGVSISRLFLAGIIPGMLVTSLLMGFSYLSVRKQDIPLDDRVPFGELFKRFLQAFPALMMPGIILGGIFTGTFTPTEAAVVAVVYGLLVGRFYYKELSLQNIFVALREAAVSTAVVLMLLAMATSFAWIMTSELIPQQVAGFLQDTAPNAIVFLIFVNIVLLILGTFIETTPALVLAVPILVPVAQVFGVDLIHFGVIMVLNLAIGMITPPLGLTLFIACNISGVPLSKMFRTIIPFIFVMIAALLIVTFVPSLSLYIPGLM